MSPAAELSMADANILLSITEQVDPKTIVALMCTRKANHQLITSYEHSICKTKYHQLGFQPIDGDLLSTADKDRYIVHRLTFRAVAELNQRNVHIDTLLASDFLLPTEPSQLGLTSEQLTRLRAGLKRAFHITDHLADLAVADASISIPATTTTPMPFPSTLSFPSAFPDDPIMTSTLPPYSALTPSPDFVAAVLDMPSFRRLRTAQIAYLGTLTTTDLALLKMLGDFASGAYTRAMGGKLLADPDCADRTLSFQECVLRRGTRVLWGLSEGSGKEYSAVMAGTREVLEEVRLWQAGGGSEGGGMQAGLQMTVMGLLRGRLMYGGKDEFDDLNWDDEGVSRHLKLGREIERVVDEWIGKETAEESEPGVDKDETPVESNTEIAEQSSHGESQAGGQNGSGSN